MATLFTADLHLGHTQIIKHTQRPFADAETMNRVLIDNWNSVVGAGDEVWVVGDFACRSPLSAQSFLSRLSGTKHLVTGNHDSLDTVRAHGWASVQPYAELNIEKTKVVLMHYGMRVWRGSRRGAVHLYGHSHGRLPGFQTPKGGGCLDVGSDCWNFFPVGWEDIQRRLKTLPTLAQEVGKDYEL